MNYEQHKKAVLDSMSVSNNFKKVVEIMDEMDCVKALHYVRTLHEMHEKRVKEIQGF